MTKQKDQVFLNLERVIDRWCGVEGGYGPGKRLSSLWVQAHGTAIPYHPDGVDELIGKIQDHAFFNPCPRARALRRTQFAAGNTGSGMKTVGQLHDHLGPCGNQG